MANKIVEEGRPCAALAYVLVGIVWFFADEKLRKNTYAKFHVKQAIVLLIAWVILDAVAVVLWFISWLLVPVISAFMFVIWVIAIVYAASGKQKEVLLFGKFAKKLYF